MFFAAVVAAFYYGSEKTPHLNKTTPEQLVNDASETTLIVERVIPVHFETDKGEIIKTICINDFQSLSDIQEYSGLEDYRFWDAFYELIT